MKGIRKMRTTTPMLLAAFVLSSLALPARADLIGKTVDPAEAMTRGDDDGAQVDSFFGDIGDFFTHDVAHVMTHNVLPVAKLIGKGFARRPISKDDLNGFVNGLTTSEAQVDEANPE
jgi:hypothetical protein